MDSPFGNLTEYRISNLQFKKPLQTDKSAEFQTQILGNVVKYGALYDKQSKRLHFTLYLTSTN